MRDSLKYIKIEGYIKSMNTYFDDTKRAERLYKAVDIVDNDGTNIHFNSLLVKTSLDNILFIDKKVTFYILRYKDKNQMVGCLYAMDDGKLKSYDPKPAKNQVKRFSKFGSARARFSYSTGPQAYVMGSLVIAAATAVTLGMFAGGMLGFSMEICLNIVLIVVCSVFLWAMSPLYRTNLAEYHRAEEILKNDGFDIVQGTSKIPSKY